MRSGRSPGLLVALLALVSAGCPAGPPEAPLPVATSTSPSVWSSPESCRTAVAAGDRLPREPGVTRLATWNIRWFPRGCHPDESCPEETTDIDWLACAITWLDADVIAVQEILHRGAAVDPTRSLLAALEARTATPWKLDLQSCRLDSDQNVGFLWRTDRATLEESRDEWRLNGASNGSGAACAGNLRPGRFARLVTPDGGRAHIFSAHLDSGRGAEDFGRRGVARRRLASVLASLPVGPPVVLLGDLNTMGTDGVTGAKEIEQLVADLSPSLVPLEAVPACTEYYRGEGGILDHVAVSPELLARARSRVSGFCADLGCAPVPPGEPLPPAFHRLSDHCPVLLDVVLDSASGPTDRGALR